MEYLQQFAGAARKGFDWLKGNTGRVVDYLKQVPKVGSFLEDAQPLYDLGQRTYKAVKSGNISELPRPDEFGEAYQRGRKMKERYDRGDYGTLKRRRT